MCSQIIFSQVQKICPNYARLQMSFVFEDIVIFLNIFIISKTCCFLLFEIKSFLHIVLVNNKRNVIRKYLTFLNFICSLILITIFTYLAFSACFFLFTLTVLYYLYHTNSNFYDYYKGVNRL